MLAVIMVTLANMDAVVTNILHCPLTLVYIHSFVQFTLFSKCLLNTHYARL